MIDRRDVLSTPLSRRVVLQTFAATPFLVAANRRPAVATGRVPIKAIHLNPLVTADRAGFDRLVDLIERTELNALVLDVKEEAVYYDSAVPFYTDAGAVAPRYNLAALLDVLRQRDVYAIARLVVFKDPLVAAARPDLAVLDTVTGGPWLDQSGATWLNPFAREVWEATVALAVEAANLGFDEVQFDYVRLPSDGDLSTADFGPDPVTPETRTAAIAGLLGLARERLVPTGARIAADVFGYTLFVDTDLGIGQDSARLARLVDVLCPMVYPSHFPAGSLLLPGHPNDFPSETIAISMDAGKTKLGGTARKLRPWLQDFSLPGMRAYGAEDLRAQIDAAEAGGAGGWMVWDPNNVYHETAFGPAD